MNKLHGEVARFIDHYEQERVIHRGPNGELHVKRDRHAAPYELGRAIGKHLGQRIREERQKQRMTMEALAFRAGLSNSKMRIREIETARSGGIKLGTLYAIAHALGVNPLTLLPPPEEVFSQSGVAMIGGLRLFSKEEVQKMLATVEPVKRHG